ncbi:MAG: 2-dehydropantoate 2-reductase [Acidobacteriota bacterium]|nr:2-dehydropantoate 2-reductase [Acidobacteriota bacterium]
MKSAIVGAGAVGAYMGALMARAGQDVTLFARGPHLDAMRERGVRVVAGDGEFEAHPKVSGSLAEIGRCDVVFLAVKAHSLTALAPLLSPLIGPETVVVSMQNGVPWWFFEPPLECVDPGGAVSAAIDPRRVAGSIVYFATEILSPGLIRHSEGNRISLGEPDGSRSERCRQIAETLIAAGLRCPVTARLRQEIWVKLLGNAAFNPISALTGATLAGIASDPDVCGLVRRIMEEAVAIAAKLGMEMPVSIDQRIAGAAKVGEHKTSMLQDLEAGRPMELEAVVGAVVELGDRLGIPVPHTRSVYACAKLLGRVRANS